jgi:ribose transport system permease protein
MTQTTKPATEGGGAVAVERRSRFATLDWRRYVIYIGFVVIFIFFAILLGDQGFLSPNNLLNILRQSATITVIAVGMTYVIACAEIDLASDR